MLRCNDSWWLSCEHPNLADLCFQVSTYLPHAPLPPGVLPRLENSAHIMTTPRRKQHTMSSDAAIQLCFRRAKKQHRRLLSLEHCLSSHGNSIPKLATPSALCASVWNCCRRANFHENCSNLGRRWKAAQLVQFRTQQWAGKIMFTTSCSYDAL